MKVTTTLTVTHNGKYLREVNETLNSLIASIDTSEPKEMRESPPEPTPPKLRTLTEYNYMDILLKTFGRSR